MSFFEDECVPYIETPSPGLPVCPECDERVIKVRLPKNIGLDGGYATRTGKCAKHGRVTVKWNKRG